MSKPTVRIHDMATGEVIDRVMTDAEHSEWQAQQAQAEAQAEAAAAKVAARQAVLNKLGLTADEASALLG
jgi:membrane protease subunit (stomatin/prohibitin family)